MAIVSQSLGLKLRAFRKLRGLLQTDVGEVLGLTGRVISNIETDRRELTQSEIKKIEAHYNIRLADMDTSIVQTGTPARAFAMYGEADFFEFQDQFLNQATEGAYDLWFLNAESLPMLESDKVKASWSQNIAGGTNYHIIWIVDVLDTSSFEFFLRRAKDALNKGVAAKGKNSGRIHIYAVQLNLNPPARVNTSANQYDDLQTESATSSNEAELIFHKRVYGDSLVWPAREFITRFYFDSASVVAYEPHSVMLNPKMLVLELKDVANIDGEQSSRGYVVLGREATKHFLEHLEAFKECVAANDN